MNCHRNTLALKYFTAIILYNVYATNKQCRGVMNYSHGQKVKITLNKMYFLLLSAVIALEIKMIA